jgi:uncharacterized protein (TIGR00299 family) protein
MIVVDPTRGLSGDMLLACLFALGAKPADVAKEVGKLPGLEPFRIVFGRVKRHGMAACRTRVICEKKAKHRDLKGILSMIRRSELDSRVKRLSSATFELLGEVEGAIHGVPAKQVHFHEVGAVDSIVDIVGAVVALSRLGFPRLFHRPFRLGSGTVPTSHGDLAVPAPATLAILEGRTIRLTRDAGEIVTPTGAALMKILAEEISSALEIIPVRTVYAAGTRDESHHPGMLRLIEAEQRPVERDIFALRTTIDDMNPEVYQHLQDRLFEAGALEVYLTQLIMKKGRPGVQVTVLCGADSLDSAISILFEETTTLGIRIATEGRTELERWTEEVGTQFGRVTVKKGRLRDGSIKSSPEYESCREIAIRKDVPILDVYREAASGAHASRGTKARAKKRKKRGPRAAASTKRRGIKKVKK